MNGTKLFRTAGAALLAAGLAAGQAVAADLWIHIKVHDTKRDGDQVAINLPLSMARNLSAMIADEDHGHGRVRIHERDYDVAEFRRAWREIERGPDANYLTVRDPESDVKIAKRGDYLEMRASGRGGKREEVEARVPLPVIAALLSGSGDDLNIDAALDELTRHGQGELLTVHGDDGTVRIWVDHDSEGR